MKIHFISGLPRSGSTLLAALLRQCPEFSTGISSPLYNLYGAALQAMSGKNELAWEMHDGQREEILKGIVRGYYGPDSDTNDLTYFDTGRMWTTKLASLIELYPKARVIVLMRDPAWILDSIERQVQRHPFKVSRIFGFDPSLTLEQRCARLMAPDGMIGGPMAAMQEALAGLFSDFCLPVQYENLASNPLGELEHIHGFLDLPTFVYDFENVRSMHAEVFDAALGTPGLHAVRKQVRYHSRKTILPEVLWNRYTLHK
jgi:sulfotransferase